MIDIFSGIEPKNFYQNSKTGENNIESARAAKFDLYIYAVGDEKYSITDTVKKFNSQSEHIKVGLKTPKSFHHDLHSQAKETGPLIGLAVCLVVAYLLIFLGSCSPIHCRIVLCSVTAITILLSTVAGYSISYQLGYGTGDVHSCIPFLMLGIGIDDVFVVCNAFD